VKLLVATSRVRALVLVLLLAFASSARAQTVVAGQVVNRGTRTVLPRVLVELLDAADSVIASTTSGTDGTFALEAPAAGTYRVRLTAPESDSHVSDTLTVALGDYLAREFPINPAPKAFLEFQVDRPVVTAKGSQVPRYPDALRQQGISGCVLARFVVDERGLADTTTFRVIRFSRIEFAHAVRAALPGMRFTPAQINGRRVRQVVQQPYDFSIVSSDQTARVSMELAKVVQGPPPPRPPPPPIPAPKPAMCP